MFLQGLISFSMAQMWTLVDEPSSATLLEGKAMHILPHPGLHVPCYTETIGILKATLYFSPLKSSVPIDEEIRKKCRLSYQSTAPYLYL